MIAIKWLEDALRELWAVSAEEAAGTEPDEMVRKEEKEVGVISEPLRKLWFLRLRYGKKFLEGRAAMITLRKETREKKAVELRFLLTQTELLGEMFWISVRTEFPELWKESSIGIRKGWKVVACKIPRRPELPQDILEMLGGEIPLSILIGVGLMGDEDETPPPGSPGGPTKH